MVSLRRFIQDPVEAMNQEKISRATDRESQQQEQRVKLRDFATQLREVKPNATVGPANPSWPSFKLSSVENYTGALDPGQFGKAGGQLSPAAQKEFDSLLKLASTFPDAARRDDAVGRAAKVVAKEVDHKHGIKEKEPSLLAVARQEARAQITFASREVGERIGLSKTESTVIGYALERALEREAFKVIASHAIDRGADLFKATAAAVSGTVTHAAKAESSMAKSLNWLADHGVNRETMKEFAKKHAGKITLGIEAFTNPEVGRRAAQIMAHSGTAAEGLAAMVKDKELRGAVGTMMVGAGDALTSSQVGRSAGSAAILAGSMLRGDSVEDTSRHVFRTAMAVAGGAMGALAGGGVASVVTGVAGAAAGSALADKMLEIYDSKMGAQPQAHTSHVSKEELRDSSQIVGDRLKQAGVASLNEHAPKQSGSTEASTSDRVAAIGREYSMSTSR